MLAVAFLASGAALVASIFTRAPLSLTLALCGGVAILAGALRWSSTDAGERPYLKAQLLTGLVAGVAATAAYDLVRFLLVTAGRLSFNPFESFPLFGYLILGESVSRQAAVTVGTAFHLLNGIAFGVSYCLLLGGRHWITGVLWALGLEAAMVTIYPTWLDLEAVRMEFLSVSLFGHLAYGLTLGVIGQRRLRRARQARPPGDTGTGEVREDGRREG